MRTIRAAAALLLLAVAARCAETDEAAPKWTYDIGINTTLGLAQWGNGYPDCLGERQSPILLSRSNTVECIEEEALEYTFFSGTCNDTALGVITYAEECSEQPYLQVAPAEGAGAAKTYNFLQLHIHSSAEHSMGGGYADAELHIVHQNAAAPQDLLVLAVMLHSTASDVAQNVLIGPLLEKLADEAIDPSAANGSGPQDLYSLLPPRPEYFTYLGSLTAPPCSETVTWVILEQPSYISTADLASFREQIAGAPESKVDKAGNNARPPQPDNGRKAQYCSF